MPTSRFETLMNGNPAFAVYDVRTCWGAQIDARLCIRILIANPTWTLSPLFCVGWGVEMIGKRVHNMDMGSIFQADCGRSLAAKIDKAVGGLKD
jgi:hypothetical protein